MHTCTHMCIYVDIANIHSYLCHSSIAIMIIATWMLLCKLPEFYGNPGDSHRSLLFIFKFVSEKGLHLSLESQRKIQSQKFKNNHLECFIRSSQTVPHFQDKKRRKESRNFLANTRSQTFLNTLGKTAKGRKDLLAHGRRGNSPLWQGHHGVGEWE